MSDTYLGNPNLKAANVTQKFTEEQVKEFIKCSSDPEYFIENYVKIISMDEGLVSFDLYPFQRKMVNTFHDNRFVICKLPRQSGKSTTIVSYLLHYVLFNEHVNVAILANKGSTAREILSRLQLAYEHLPNWLQQGVVIWNKGNFELENGSKVMAASTSSSAVRGSSFNIIFLDEFAHIDPPSLAENFFDSVYPTISSGKTTKVFIVSTPKGLNKFYKLWVDAEQGNSDYVPVEIHWSEVPGRDEEWKKETIRNTSEQQFRQEFECQFLGSTNTLIDPVKLQSIPIKKILSSKNNLDIYDFPEENGLYCVVADASEGLGMDYSAAVVVDITKNPYKIVAKYRSNEISPIIFPEVLYNIGKKYNNAFMLIELNANGQQVASILHYDLEYDNILMTSQSGRDRQEIGGGFGVQTKLGVKTSTATKKIGCVSLKALVEEDQLLIPDIDIIDELSRFSVKGNTYAAEEGSHDDLTMCCVLFSWATQSAYFRELTNTDLRFKILEERQKQIEDEILPFGFIDDGIDEQSFKDETGQRWYPVEDKYKTVSIF